MEVIGFTINFVFFSPIRRASLGSKWTRFPHRGGSATFPPRARLFMLVRGRISVLLDGGWFTYKNLVFKPDSIENIRLKILEKIVWYLFQGGLFQKVKNTYKDILGSS
ncbi:predicted protein [Arabidopsis lyrata subsp. lyrata]|uniref:Predicted protein n=1 Tax=Arabidopsis lyrata subsp. lyrata TaxID=81972 RepID=D7LP96_ARALL|nr:predicted protein [Arabidopsis lyrata subsp. lyrata]